MGKKADKLTPGDRQIRQALAEAGEKQKTDKQKAKEVWKSRFLTEEEKTLREASKGSMLDPSVLRARWHLWRRDEGFRSCCRRKREGFATDFSKLFVVSYSSMSSLLHLIFQER